LAATLPTADCHNDAIDEAATPPCVKPSAPSIVGSYGAITGNAGASYPHMGELQDVMGPYIAKHAEAAYFFGLIKALEDGTLDARIERISVLLRPPEPPSGSVDGFL
jgi:hypothetical protein